MGDVAEMMWIVEEYCDQIRQKTEKKATEKWMGQHDKYKHRFESEDEARNFIVVRAARRVEDAKKELIRAENRLRNCNKKFGFRL